MEKKGRKAERAGAELAADIRASLREARDHTAGKSTGAVVHGAVVTTQSCVGRLGAAGRYNRNRATDPSVTRTSKTE